MGYTITPERKFSPNADYRKYIIMNKSNHSYAINNQIVSVFPNDCWKHRRCFIIGGGPSLKGFDFSRLKGELTIGINKAFEYFPDATINYAMDSDFYNKLEKGVYDRTPDERLWDKWMLFKGTRVFLTPMEIKEFGKEVHLVRRNIELMFTRELNDGIYGGCNSGFGAIMLAATLGAAQIYLLGYDMKTTDTQSHWHGGYPNRDLVDFNKKLTKYKREIQNVLPQLRMLGVEVTNLSTDSELKCLNTDTLENVLKESICPVIKM